ncbi:DUF3302 domain-containing protein [Pseudomonadota bacterium]
MKLELISLFLIFFSIIVIILGIIKVHTYPGKIAKARNHPQVEAIEVTSLLGLLIFPLWMAALVWAYSGAVVGRLYAAENQDELEKPPVDGPAGRVTPGEPAGNAAASEPGA